MPPITMELLRKRAEHNEGMVSTLEELSLHQEEIEKIEIIGTICRKLKILYLQNNIISKIENLQHCRDLEYLNLALNCVTNIEGLTQCEFLNKLDLTVNFIDFDKCEESIDHLAQIPSLRELFMMGNPCQSDWDGFNNYVIARLPSLKWLDGKEITLRDRIVAKQDLPRLIFELREKAAEKREEIAEKKKEEEAAALAADTKGDDHLSVRSDVVAEPVTDPENETCPYTPESRVEMYREIAEQKAEKEKVEKEREPRKRDWDKEHVEALEKARAKEAEFRGEVRQCNEGKFDFSMNEDDEVPGAVVVRVKVPKYLDMSLINVDPHPLYVTIVIKNKTLRLAFPEEVRTSDGTAKRSQLTGELVLTFFKLNAEHVVRPKETQSRKFDAPVKKRATSAAEKIAAEKIKTGPLSVKEEMARLALQEGRAKSKVSAAVDVGSIVAKEGDGTAASGTGKSKGTGVLDMQERKVTIFDATTSKVGREADNSDSDDSDEPPPLDD